MSPHPYRCIYLSPHLDDVVLSCGGTIHVEARRGVGSLVVSVFAGSPPSDSPTPFARELKERWGSEGDPVAERRREDVAAVACVGATAEHLSFLDCVYRASPAGEEPLYATEEAIFGPVHPAEDALHEAVLAALRPTLLASPGATIVAPLTIGHHVDHVIVYRAAMALLAGGLPVTFYEDYPYSAEPESVRRGLPALGRGAWHRDTLLFEEQDLRAQQDGVASYRSQISTFWRSLAEMRADLAARAFAVGGGRPGEHRWRIRAATPIGAHAERKAR